MSGRWETVSEWAPSPRLGRQLMSVRSVPIYFRAAGLRFLVAIFGVYLAMGLVGGRIPGWIPLVGHLSIRAFAVGVLAGGMGGLVLHETGHAVAALARGQRLGFVVVSVTAAVVIGEPGDTFTAKDLAITALAGPLTNVAIAIAAGVAAALSHGDVSVALALVAVINGLGMSNLVPFYLTGPLGLRCATDGMLVRQALRSARTGMPVPPVPQKTGS